MNNGFKPTSKKNLRRTVLYGVLSVLSLVFVRSWIFFLIFLGITIANAFLTHKSKLNEEAYFRKLAEAEGLLAEDMTEEERKKLFHVGKAEKIKGKQQLESLLESYAADDAKYEAYEAEYDNSDDEYDYEGEDNEG